MPLFAIVPVQRLENAKSRLASILSSNERRRLVIKSLSTVLAALGNSVAVDQIVVVSPDAEVLQQANGPKLVALEQRGRGLNQAIRMGRERALKQGADALLVVLGDLPLLTSTEIDRLIAVSTGSAVTLAPDRHGHGTNALILRPPDVMEPSFGVDSFQIHSADARHRKLSISVVELNGTAFDVDTIDDLIDLGWIDPVTHDRHIPTYTVTAQ